MIPPAVGDVHDQLARQVAADHYAGQTTLAAGISQQALEAWRQVDPDDAERSWLRQVARQVMAIVTAGQQLSARRGAEYVRRVLGVRLDPPRPVAQVRSERLAGIAADGRPLETLLLQPAVTTTRARREGRSRRESHIIGSTQLDMIVRTQIADAGRVSTGVGITATPTVGYVRVVNLPACSRCIVLAGRWYRWSAGFERHPRCDCVHQPATREQAAALTTDPDEVFAAMPQAEQDRVFGRSGAQAIRDGANLGRVVNARRGMYTASIGGRQVAATREATTRRGGVRRRVRLMPEQIYRIADGNRDEALRLLRVNGYIT